MTAPGLIEKEGLMTHQTISFIKSGIRFAGYAALLGPGTFHLYLAVALLFLSEGIGVLEEVGSWQTQQGFRP